MGSVDATVSMHSSTGSLRDISVERMVEVSVERMLAFTPLPNPSERTTVSLPFSFVM